MSQGDGIEPVVGMTGARFGGGRRKRKVAADAAAAASDAITEPLPLVAAAESVEVHERSHAPGVGQTGARFGGRARRERAAHTEDADDPVAFRRPADPAQRAVEDWPYEDWPYEDRPYEDRPYEDRFDADRPYEDRFDADRFDENENDVDADRFDEHGFDTDGEFEETDSEEIAHIAVRPYVLTGGRTRPAVDLAIEALVSVSAEADHQLDRRPDHAAVLELCGVPRSVAEIAALMQVALGVARVLVGDLAESGSVIVHRTSGAAGPDIALLERVLGGLRKL